MLPTLTSVLIGKAQQPRYLFVMVTSDPNA
jgi:hypothetical protein